MVPLLRLNEGGIILHIKNKKNNNEYPAILYGIRFLSMLGVLVGE